MPISVNERLIDDARIARERMHHADLPDPEAAARRALAVRELLLQEALRLGIGAGVGNQMEDGDEEERIERLIAREVRTPEPTEEECRRYYENNRARFRSGELVEARHILFQQTPAVPTEALRARAEAVLAEVREAPERFPALAERWSNCPSGARGGSLGQLLRGQTVPEFERWLFALHEGELAPRLVETRFGLHVVQVLRRAPGRELPFEAAHPRIAEALRRRVRQKALLQYVQVLAGRARMEGVSLPGSATPLVQ